ncbi:MAG TPA: hypothetical protein VMX38_01470 [Verrucomicrobiae bacterium]|jgi:hypothetical protein|nr:hypothetical protein [Verrucomicrobiae bacterium]
MRRNRDDEGNSIVRVELKYCERCGALWVRECGAGVMYCEKCQGEVAELPIPTRRKPGRPRRPVLPVRRGTLIEDMPGDEMELEAAGGVQ